AGHLDEVRHAVELELEVHGAGEDPEVCQAELVLSHDRAHATVTLRAGLVRRVARQGLVVRVVAEGRLEVVVDDTVFVLRATEGVDALDGRADHEGIAEELLGEAGVEVTSQTEVEAGVCAEDELRAVRELRTEDARG